MQIGDLKGYRLAAGWTGVVGLVCLAAALLVVAPRPARAASPSVDLSGAWLTHAGNDKTWGAAKVEETTWTSIQLPGAPVGPGFVWYRKHFKIPFDWSSDNVAGQLKWLDLHLGAVNGAVEIYLNGYLVNRLGAVPTDANGTGFKPYESANPSDVVAQIATTTKPTGIGGTPIPNWGEDNVIAIRLYTDKNGANPSAGSMHLDLPTYSDIYPVTIQPAVATQLFDSSNPVSFKLIFSNLSGDDAPLVWSMDIADDLGHAPPGFESQDVSNSIKAGEDVAYPISLGLGDTPGFYTIKITSKVNDDNVPTKSIVVGWDAYHIRPALTAAPDFGDFWSALRNDSNAKPLNAQVTADAATGATAVKTYRVQFDGLDGKPARAWVSVPASLPSKPIAILHIPAYEADRTAPDTALAAKGYIVMDFLVTANDWTSGNSDQKYLSQGIEDPKTYIVRTVEGNILRASRILAGGLVPGVSGKPRIALWGESQGGGLALIAGGLLKDDISAVVAVSPYFTDMSYQLDTVKPDFNPFLAYFPAKKSMVKATLTYFDALNFAPKITAPTFVGVGLKDTISPPYTAFALANHLNVDHVTDINVAGEHIPPASEDKGLAWLASTLK